MTIWCVMGVIVANPPDGSKWSSAASFPISYHNVEAISVCVSGTCLVMCIHLGLSHNLKPVYMWY